MTICLALFLAAAPGPQMLRSWLQDIGFRQLAARKERIAAIQTREQFEARRAEVRRLLLVMMGGLPGERGSLNLRKTGTIDRGDYRVEKIFYESLPKVYVTANLYVPQTGKPPYAAVLQPTGHSLAAKARAFYQTLALGLVKNGLVVLTYDPTGQGERGIFYDAALGDSKVGGTTTEHEMVGIQSLLAGESIARYMVWDGMRGIDLLQSLPYVDRKRIGVSGCSGGGTLTAYLAALDDRVKAAAPACYISDWEDQLPGTGPQDAEQQFPDQLRNGLNHADLVEAFAPKPYLICSTKEDFFPIAGSRKAYDESRRIYALYGAEDRIATFVGEGGHGMPKPQREAIYAWMKRWLDGGSGEAAPEPAFQTEYEEDLLVTPTGHLLTSLGGDNASTLNVRRFSAIHPPKPVPALRDQILRLTRYEATRGPLNARTLQENERDGYRATRLVYDAGPGRSVPALLLQPQGGGKYKSAIYVDERGKSERGDPLELVKLGYTVLAIDVAGTGETAPSGASYSEQWFGQGRVIWLALMVGRPLTGLRMEDIIRGIDLLRERGLLYNGGCLGFGKGTAGVSLLHAAVMDPRIAGVAVEDGLLSYAAVARAPIHRHIFDTILPGVLRKYDLPDLVSALAPRPVWLVNMRSPAGQPVFLREVKAEYGTSARIGLRREEESVAAAYPGLP